MKKPFALSFFPSGAGRKPDSLIRLNDPAIQLTAFKKAETSENYVIRLYNPTSRERTVLAEIPALGIGDSVSLGSYEVKTMEIDITSKKMREVNLMEDSI